jgi:hypothetical protein
MFHFVTYSPATAESTSSSHLHLESGISGITFVKKSRRMLGNTYKCLTITTHALSPIQMACHQSEWLATAYENGAKTMRIFFPGEC